MAPGRTALAGKRRIAVQQPAAHWRTYEGLGRLIRTTYPDPDGAGPQVAATETYLRNQRGLLLYKQLRYPGTNGDRWQRYFYDVAGRQTYLWEMQTGDTYPKGKVFGYGYDLAQRPVWTGVYDNPSTSWTALQAVRNTAYSPMGNVGTECVNPDYNNYPSDTPCFSYLWDGNNNRTKITWNDGQVAIYAYDGKNRLSTVSFQSSNSATYAYDGLSRVSSITRSNGTSTAYTYSNRGDLLTLTHNFAAGSTPGAIGYTYTYDDAGKVETAAIMPTSLEWSAPAGYARTYGVANSLNQVASEAGVGLTFDSRGNMTFDGQNTYTYDPSNRMLTASRSGMSASYKYDESDRRVKKTVNGTATTMLYSYAGEELAQSTTGYPTNLWYKFIPGLGVDDRVAATDNNQVVYWNYTDRLGSVVAQSWSAGQVNRTSIYSPYGELGAGSSLPAGGWFGYAGREYDPETTLYQNRARMYNSRLGQFMQPDPILSVGGINLYGYVGADPTNGVDPTGEWTVSLGIGGWAAAGAGLNGGAGIVVGAPNSGGRLSLQLFAGAGATLGLGTGGGPDVTFSQGDPPPGGFGVNAQAGGCIAVCVSKSGTSKNSNIDLPDWTGSFGGIGAYLHLTPTVVTPNLIPASVYIPPLPGRRVVVEFLPTPFVGPDGSRSPNVNDPPGWKNDQSKRKSNDTPAPQANVSGAAGTTGQAGGYGAYGGYAGAYFSGGGTPRGYVGPLGYPSASGFAYPICTGYC